MAMPPQIAKVSRLYDWLGQDEGAALFDSQAARDRLEIPQGGSSASVGCHYSFPSGGYLRISGSSEVQLALGSTLYDDEGWRQAGTSNLYIPNAGNYLVNAWCWASGDMLTGAFCFYLRVKSSTGAKVETRHNNAVNMYVYLTDVLHLSGPATITVWGYLFGVGKTCEVVGEGAELKIFRLGDLP